MALFDIPEKTKTEQKPKSNGIKLKKGQTIQDLVVTARQIVMEKLGKYKDASRCITDINDLRKFFEDTPDGSEIGVDTETTGLNFYQDKIVGLSLCNGKEALYVPINHKSSVYNTKLKNQIPEEDIRQLFKELKETKNYKWIKV